MYRISSLRRGMVVVWALVLTAVATTIVGALGAYYVQSARISHFYMNGTNTRFVEQRVLENVTADVKNAVDAFTSGSKTMVGDFTSTKSIEEIVDVIKAQDGKTLNAAGGYALKLSASGYQELEKSLRYDGAAEVTLTAEVVKTPHGGLQAGTRVRQTLRFESDTESAATTIPVFDYVYFANNNGRLNSKCIVANGDVGANGKFDLKGATLNGFAKAGGKITLYTGEDNPKIWPRPTYMAFVAAQYNSYFTQTRPTDPIEGVTGTAPVPWPGGYDPARTSNPYSADYDDPPEVVDGPGTKPSWNGAVPSPPKPEDYKAQTQPLPKVEDYKNPQAEPKKNQGNYQYPNEPTCTTVWVRDFLVFGHDEYAWYYKGTKIGQDRNVDSQYKTQAYGSWNADKAALDQQYETDHKAWKEKNKELQEAYDSEYTRIEKANQEAKEKAAEDFETAQTKYQDDLKKYKEYEDELSAWNGRNNAYQKYQENLKDYNTKLSKYLEERAAWNTRYAKGEQIDNLTWETVGESSSTNTILKEKSELIEWPAEIANAANCRKYCSEYSLAETNAQGQVTSSSGTLRCENRWNNKQISFSCAGTNRTEYIQAKGNLTGRVGDVLATENGNITSITRTLKSVNVSGGGVSESFVPITDVAKNLSSDQLNAIHANELGSVVLIGTQEAPIFLNGPVFVPGDVVIRGLVSGRGTIYAGRNVHIIGDISYQNPPNWPHECDDLTEHAEYAPSNVKIANSTKDLLSLVAIGNIIVGDYTSGIWTNSTQMGYLNLSGQDNLNISTSAADPSVGSKDHDYSAEDGGTVYDFKYTHTHDSASSRYVPGRVFPWTCVKHEYEYAVSSRKRRYYESKFGGYTIAGLKQTTAVGTAASWNTSTRFIKQLVNTIVRGIESLFGIRQENVDVSGYNPATVPNLDPGDIVEIDAVLFANHGIFGVVGGDSNHSFTLNGAMICRDEGLMTSFDDRFSQYDDARAWLNWDMRVKSGSAEGVRMGLIETQQSSKTALRVFVSDWQQL